MFTDASFSDGSLHATLKAPEKITGDASICVVRGKKRYLFDFNFKLPFEVAVSGGGNYKGSYTMNEISNDEDYEVSIVSIMLLTLLGSPRYARMSPDVMLRCRSRAS